MVSLNLFGHTKAMQNAMHGTSLLRMQGCFDLALDVKRSEV